MFLQNLVAEELGNDSKADTTGHCSWLGSCENEEDMSPSDYGRTIQGLGYRKAKLFTTSNPRNALDPDDISGKKPCSLSVRLEKLLVYCLPWFALLR